MFYVEKGIEDKIYDEFMRPKPPGAPVAEPPALVAAPLPTSPVVAGRTVTEPVPPPAVAVPEQKK